MSETQKTLFDIPEWDENVEGFERHALKMEDVDKVWDKLRAILDTHFKNYGDGIFMSPHELSGCMAGQQNKLIKVADESIYAIALDDVDERVYKMLVPLVVGAASVEVWKKMRGID